MRKLFRDICSWIKDIVETVTTIFEGMSITFSHLVRRPTTIQYPDRIEKMVQDTLPLRYRGHLEVDMDICTNCKACERDCPITCIAITDSEDPKQKRWMTQFDIDLCKCMYCGICAEVCPTGAIRHSQEFEGASYNPLGLVRRFAIEGAYPPFKPPKKGAEVDEKLEKKIRIGKDYMDEFAQPEKK